MRARYYNTDIERFISQDILTGNPENSQSLNRYAYCQGNPVNQNDPFGLCPMGLTTRQWIHLGLDLLGCIPVIGIAANAVNAVLYFQEGDILSGLLSVAGAVIGIGGLSSAIGAAKGICTLADGNTVTVTNVAYEDTHATVYNFEVEDFHTYYVGTESVLVHNNGGNCMKTASALAQGESKGGSGTGTVWANIDINGQKFGVAPNGTKHMQEYITRDGQHIGTFTTPMSSQAMLAEFESSLSIAINNNGLVFDEMIYGGGWEFIIVSPRQEGLNNVIKHARYNPQ